MNILIEPSESTCKNKNYEIKTPYNGMYISILFSAD